MLGPEELELEEMDPADDMPHWMTVSRYRIHWDERWPGSFEITSEFFPLINRLIRPALA